MMVKEFKKGDRVIANSKNPALNNRAGTVAYVSGIQYWVKFDDSEEIHGGIYGWWLEPLFEEARFAERAA